MRDSATDRAYEASERSLYVSVWVVHNGTTTTMSGDGANAEIISLEWDNIICSNDGIQIGTACMDEVKLKYHYRTTSIEVGDVLSLSSGYG